MGDIETQNADKTGSLPEYLQWILIFLNKAGFPVVAFGAIFWLVVIGIKTQVRATEENTKALAAITASIDGFHQEVRNSHLLSQQCLNAIMSECKIKPRF